MKKIKSIFVIVLLFVFVCPTWISALEPTLDDIALKFNNSEIINTYKNLLGWELNASVNDNILSITQTKNEVVSTINYVLDGNILSNDNLDDDGYFITFFLGDAIGEIHGYNNGEFIENANMFPDEIKAYTIDNEGLEFRENKNTYSIQIDITKKIPLIDPSEFYLKPEEFDFVKQIIDEKSTGNQTGKNSKLAYDIIIGEDESYIYMGENDELTKSSYKSILSALEVMYGTEFVDYFKEEYSSLEDGTAYRDGFDIEVDYDIDVNDMPIFTGKKVVLITLDNKYIIDMFLRREFIGEVIERGDKSITIDFTNGNTYKLGFFDSVSTGGDAAFLFKYVLEPIFIESDVEIIDDTAYFNIVDGKIVVGDKDNSIFKLVIYDDYLEILATNNDVVTTTVSANHENVKSREYEECEYGHDHHRYGNYNLNINIIYGDKKENIINPKTSDSITTYIMGLLFSVIVLVSTKQYLYNVNL